MIIEAVGGCEGLRGMRGTATIRLSRPNKVEMSGFEVLERLKSDPATNDIPVVIMTSKALEEEER